MGRFFTGTLVVVLTVMLGVSTGFARYKYEEVDVKNGGSISGVVNFKGDVPGPVEVNMAKEKNTDFCVEHTEDGKLKGEATRLVHRVEVKDGKLKGTVVFIQDLSKGKKWPLETINFDFENCDISPRVGVIRRTPRKHEGKRVRDGVMTITNHDEEILHNPHGYSVLGARRKTLWNKPLPSKGDVADVTRNLMRMRKGKDEHIFLQCDQHNFMQSDSKVVWNPYYHVTGADGAFKITNIPPGTYKVTAWHPRVGEVTKEIKVEGGSEAKANFELDMKKKK